MVTKPILMAVLLATAATPTFAQQFTGAEGQIKYQPFSAPGGDFDIISLSAGAEATILPNFGIGGNLLIDSIEDQDDQLFNGTVHLMYMLSPDSAVGVFLTNESQGDFQASSFGLEGGYATGNGGVDGYFGVVNSDDIGGNNVTYGGINLAFDVGSNFTIGFGYDAFIIEDGVLLPSGLNDLTTSDLSIFASYEVVDGVSVFAELGQVSLSATDGDTIFTSTDDSEYISVGASYTFERGTIFDARGYNSFGR